MAHSEQERLLRHDGYDYQYDVRDYSATADAETGTNREARHPENNSSNLSAKRDVADDVLPETAVTGRKLGWISAYILVLSRVIGSGIFAMPGTILQSVGSPGLALSVWVLGALIAWCALAIDIEYGCMLPRSGGLKVYLEYTYRRPRFLASMIVAVHTVLLGFTASNCIVFAKYMLFALEVEATDFMVKLFAVALMTVVTLVHGCAYRTGVWIQNLLGWLKIGLILFMILTGLYVVCSPAAKVPEEVVFGEGWAKMLSGIWEESDWSYNTVSTALFKIYYSYAGLENLNNVLNEVKDPVKTLKRAPLMALLTACVLYLLVNLAYLAVIPISAIKESRELIAALFFERVFGQGFGSKFLPVAIALSAAGNVMVVTFSVEVARQGFLPLASFLASTRPFNSPFGGLLVHYIPSVLVIILPPSSNVYALIADIGGYTGQWFALAVGAGLLILRYRKPDLLRPFKAWTPAVFIRITICLLLIIAPMFPPKARLDGGKADTSFFYASYAVVSISILAFSILYWAIWTRWLPRYYGCVVEEETSTLEDGITVTKLIWQPRDSTA